jgi:hypothetical protein
MINLKTTDTVTNCTRNDKRIYKNSLLERSMENEWKLSKIKQYGSVEAYWEQYKSGEEYFKELGWN